MNLDKTLSLSKQFLDTSEVGFIKNENGVYRYNSQDGNHLLNLDGVFSDFIDWLIENEHLKEQ